MTTNNSRWSNVMRTAKFKAVERELISNARVIKRNAELERKMNELERR